MIFLLAVLPTLLIGGLLLDSFDRDDEDDDDRAPPGDDATITGTSGDDYVRSTDRDERILGLGGNDVIWSQGGDDDLRGGPGIDRMAGFTGNDTLSGGADTDTLKDGYGANTLYGGSGNDWIDASEEGDGFGNIVRPDGDTIDGGSGNDFLIVDLGDTVTTGAGADTVSARLYYRGSQPLIFTDFDPEKDVADISLYGGTDSIPTLAETDTGVELTVAGGPTILFEGTSLDALLTNRSALQIRLNGVDGVVPDAPDRPDNVMTFGDGDDSVYVRRAEDVTIFGGAGEDEIFVTDNNAEVYGGRGDDEIINFRPSGGDDASSGQTTLDGGGGNDVLSAGFGDTLTGGEGRDSFRVRTDDPDDLACEITDFDPAREFLTIYSHQVDPEAPDPVEITRGATPDEAVVSVAGQIVVRLADIADLDTLRSAIRVYRVDFG